MVDHANAPDIAAVSAAVRLLLAAIDQDSERVEQVGLELHVVHLAGALLDLAQFLAHEAYGDGARSAIATLASTIEAFGVGFASASPEGDTEA